ncbi:MAG: putative quinol monooxygenase [Terriglobia bacterium]
MLVVHIHCRVKPEWVEAFKEATIENARNSIKEQGIARFDVMQQTDDPTHFVLVEAYRTDEARALHRETAHFHAWKQRAEPMLAEDRTRASYSNVFPGDEDF